MIQSMACRCMGRFSVGGAVQYSESPRTAKGGSARSVLAGHGEGANGLLTDSAAPAAGRSGCVRIDSRPRPGPASQHGKGQVHGNFRPFARLALGRRTAAEKPRPLLDALHAEKPVPGAAGSNTTPSPEISICKRFPASTSRTAIFSPAPRRTALVTPRHDPQNRLLQRGRQPAEADVVDELDLRSTPAAADRFTNSSIAATTPSSFRRDRSQFGHQLLDLLQALPDQRHSLGKGVARPGLPFLFRRPHRSNRAAAAASCRAKPSWMSQAINCRSRS